MKTSAGNILTTGAGFAQRLFSRLKSTLCTSAEIAPELGHQSETSRAKPVTQLVAAVMLTLISTALLAPRTAEAWPELLDSIFFNYNTSAQAYQCGNCHTTWFSAGPGYSSLTDFVLFNPRYTSPTSILANNGMYVMDADNDGSSNLAEIKMSQSITRPPQFATGVSTGPNVANNWNWQLPDVDGDGCSTYFSRFTEEGMFGDTSAVAGASIVGTGTTTNNYKRFNPRGWDMDDNDASQGCSLAWTNTTIAVAPGTSGDFTPPGKVNTLSGAALASGAIPLKWVPVGDDGNGNPGDTTGGKAHSYDLRFTTTAFANGTSGRNPRSAADWRTMFDIRDTNPSYTGTWANGSVSLRQALYEPRPDAPSTPTTIQTCNAIGTTCTAGASYDIKARGVNVVVNPISNLTTYWIAMLVQDGVTRLGAGGTLTTPVSVTEQSTLSNIIAVTAGGSGAAISSISPTTLTGTAVITVNGFGLANLSTNALGAAYQMVLTDVAGLVKYTATGLTYPATNANGNLTGTFNFPIAAGTYNLELRTAGTPGVTKAAWVNAITAGAVIDLPPLTSLNPNARGQGAANQTITLVGSDLAGGTVSFTGTGITPNPSTVVGTGTTGPFSTVISVAPNATVETKAVIATTTGGTTSLPVSFTVTAAPTFTCTPAISLTGTVGVVYPTSTCTATGGVAPYTWIGTAWPTGVSSVASGATLTVSGTPTTAGTFLSSITLSDANSGTTSAAYSIVIGYNVTATANAFFVFSPASRTVNIGNTAVFTITPISSGYTAVVITTCANGGSLVGTTYTTGVIVANCAVSAIPSDLPIVVTATATAGGTISPPSQFVNRGSTATFTVTPNAGYSASVTTSCANGGSLVGTTYTTGAIVANCSVSASFIFSDVTVTATAGQNGTITPPSQLVPTGSTASFNVTPNAGYTASVTTTCANGGSLSGTTYTTGAIMASCAVSATFTPVNYIVICTGSGNGVVTPATQSVIGGGSATCNVTPLAGYTAAVTSTCPGGSLVGTTYTTGAIVADCAVSATFTAGGDTTPPVITANPPGRYAPPFIGPLTVTLSSNEPVTIYYTLNGSTPTTSSLSCTAPCTLIITRSTILQYIGKDTAGNVSSPAYQVYPIYAVDLVLTQVTKTATTVKRGMSFGITTTVRNKGTLGTVVPIQVGFYLSADRTITTADRKLTGERTIPPLAAGQSSPSATTTVTVPATLAPGVYFVGACVDIRGAVRESSESNNCRAAGYSGINGSATINVTL